MCVVYVCVWYVWHVYVYACCVYVYIHQCHNTGVEVIGQLLGVVFATLSLRDQVNLSPWPCLF